MSLTINYQNNIADVSVLSVADTSSYQIYLFAGADVNLSNQNIGFNPGFYNTKTEDQAVTDRLDNYNVIQDSSILSNLNDISQLDASIILLEDYNVIQDASILAIDVSVENLYTKGIWEKNNSDIYYNESGGNVGIGTTSPDTKLDVVGEFMISNTKSDSTNKLGRIIGPHYMNSEEYFLAFDIRSLETSNEIFYGGGSSVRNAATLHSFFTGPNSTSLQGTEKMRIDASGNVGIGTTEPLAKLHIDGGVGGLATGLAFGDGDTGIYENTDDELYFSFGGDERIRMNTAGISGVSSDTAQLSLFTATSTFPVFQPMRTDNNTGMGWAGDDILSLIAGGVNVLNCTSTGRVGIGTTTPNNLLELYSNVPRFTVTTAGVVSWNPSGVGGILSWDTGRGIVSSNVGNDLALATGLSERIRITNIGRVGIGTADPSSKLHIDGSVGSLAGGLAFGDGDTGIYESSDDVLRIRDGVGGDIVETTSNGLEMIGSKRMAFGAGQYAIARNLLAYTGESLTANTLQIIADNGVNQGIQFGGDDAAFLLAEFNTSNLNAIFHGKVGIGTTAPDHTLDVSGNIQANEIHYNPNITPTEENAGVTWWNDDELALNIATGIGPVLQAGQETYILIFNDTSTAYINGNVLRPKAATMHNGLIVPTVERAQADLFSTVEGTIMVATMDIDPSTVGLATRFGRVRGTNTSHLTPGATAYIDPSIAGELTNTLPKFPNYAISVGAALSSDASDGELIISVTRDISNTFNNFWNGTIRETFDLDVSVNNSIASGYLSPRNGHPDMTMLFSDGFTMLSATPDASIDLTLGTDDIPQQNFIYITKANKILEVSTSDWPHTEEHIKIGTVNLRTASTTLSDGALKNHNWNDHIQSTDTDQGHLSHVTAKLRQFEAQWDTGVEGSSTIITTSTPDDVWVNNTAGVIYQLHRHNFPVMDSSNGDDIHVVNNSANPYETITNLNTQILDANGDTLNNRSFSFVLWGVASSGNSPDHLMINLPSGSYAFNAPVNAVEDSNNYSVFTIPKIFQGTGFLIARFTYTYKNDEWTLFETEDLRGRIPNTTAGGGGGGTGVTSFTGLTDTPSAYVGAATHIARVNAGETALEFTSIATSGSPASNGTGIAGELQYDSTYLYACTSTNTWLRFLGESGY